uniref:DUF2513 domain-containing protein n=1 Tax=Trichocoleus desertorum TaxID=1481672 RepID=UPI0025B4BC32|nr:DUF2513 domain-containing protein [Trichocoleus desertorum]
MQRDWDLIRWLLNEVESCEDPYPLVLTQGMYGGEHYALDIDSQDFLKVFQHILFLGDENLAIVRVLGSKHLSSDGVAIDRLTMLGHSFLEAARDENLWTQAVEAVKEKGGSVKDLINNLKYINQTDAHLRQESNLVSDFVDHKIIEELRSVVSLSFDLSKVIRFCEEINSSFSSGNYIATTLLMRALINHIPPVFGQKTFQQVISQVSKSRRELFKPLEEVSRDVADLHTHDLIRHKENLPTRNQVEPFKPNLEVLLHEIVVEMQKE